MDSGTARLGTGIATTLMGLGALWYLAMEAVAAAGFPGYRYSQHYISDLGNPGASPLSGAMTAGFLGQGLAVVLAGVVLWWTLPAARSRGAVLALSLTYGIGSCLVGVVTSGPQHADVGFVHVLGASMAIVGGNLLVLTLGRHALHPDLAPWLRPVSMSLVVIGLTAAVVLVVVTTRSTPLLVGDGAWERAAVYPITAGQLVFATVAMARRSTL